MPSSTPAPKLPRVTEILKNYTGYEHVPKHILENAAARGTTVHALCAGIAKGAWMTDGMIHEDFKGYVDSFNQWAQSAVDEYLVIEKRYTDNGFGFSGQVDFVIKSPQSEMFLVDLKTSANPQKTYPIQMAAYRHLLALSGITVKGTALVYLNRDGEFPRVDYYEDLDDEWDVFVSALKCWNYFYKPKEKNGNKT